MRCVDGAVVYLRKEGPRGVGRRERVGDGR